ncbi:MAG: aldolase/citrate lyase family protein [Alcaligenaceae bacterium]
MTHRVARCTMFVTPTNPRFIDKAWTRGGDVYILDIEDSIPLAEKARCRGLIRESIARAIKGGASIYVRINKPFVDADLPCSVWPGVDRIMLPKTDTAAEMQYAHNLITQLEKDHGVPVGYIELSPMIETALGVVNIYEILSATPRKIWSMGGGTGYDMAVNLGIEMFVDFDQYAYTSSYVALAAMSLGIESSGGVFVHNPTGRVDQREDAIKEAEILHAAGVRQITALHPNFIEPLCTGLAPTQAEMTWAQTVLDTYQGLLLAGESMTEVNGQVVDCYEYARAVKTLEWGRACAEKDQFKAKALARAQAAV